MRHVLDLLICVVIWLTAPLSLVYMIVGTAWLLIAYGPVRNWGDHGETMLEYCPAVWLEGWLSC